MPGLRYGPDITDDAEILRKNIARLNKLKKSGNMSERKRRELADAMNAMRRGFGNMGMLNKFAKYSVARQGYSTRQRTRNIAGVNFKGRENLPAGLRAARRAAVAAQRAKSSAVKKTKKAKKAASKAKKAKKASRPAKKAAKKVAKKAARPAKKIAKKAARPVKKVAKKRR